jgi:hypothetical protein
MSITSKEGVNWPVTTPLATLTPRASALDFPFEPVEAP